MKITTKFMEDCAALLSVLQKSSSVAATISALQIKGMGLMSPFSIRVTGGFGEFDNLWGKKWASASNEVLVYEQLKALLSVATGFSFPNLGPKALVTYDGQQIVAPTNPTTPGTYRLEVDLSKACALAWKTRPSQSSGIENGVFSPLVIAIGTFPAPVVGANLEFPNAAAFFAWLLPRTVYEPLTLVFSDEVHDFCYPAPVPDLWTSDSTGVTGYREVKPYNFRAVFRGRGRLIVTSATNLGQISVAPSVRFRFFATQGVNLEFRNPMLLNRDIEFSPVAALDVRRCTVSIRNRMHLNQDLVYAPGEGESHEVGYGLRIHRCRVIGEDALAYIGVNNEVAAGYSWASVSSCFLRNVAFGGSAVAAPDATPTEVYRQRFTRLGVRLFNCKLRYSTALLTDLNAVSVATAVRGTFTLTVQSCKGWLGQVAIGSLNSQLGPIVNLVNSFLRSTSLTIRSSVRFPTLLRLFNSSWLVNALSISYGNLVLDAQNVDWGDLQVPGFVFVQHSDFGIARSLTVPGVANQIVGVAKPAIYVDGFSHLHIPGSVDYDVAQTVFDATVPNPTAIS